jgi:hypothetical protein
VRTKPKQRDRKLLCPTRGSLLPKNHPFGSNFPIRTVSILTSWEVGLHAFSRVQRFALELNVLSECQTTKKNSLACVILLTREYLKPDSVLVRKVFQMNNSPVIAGFHRTLVNDNLQVRSICKVCQFVITSSVRDGLAEAEGDHILACRIKDTHLSFSVSPVSYCGL